MKQRHFIFILAVSLILVNTGLGFCEEAQENPGLVNAGSEGEVQWLWGEVASVDPQKGEIAVKYLDYETDSEREAPIKIDDKTTYEDINSILDIKPAATLSIDYTVGADGTYLAKNISLEKPESTPEPQEAPQGNPQQENPPQEQQ